MSYKVGHNKIRTTAINRLLSVRTLTIPGLNFLVKRQNLADWIRKQDLGLPRWLSS